LRIGGNHDPEYANLKCPVQLDSIEDNHEAFVRDRIIVRSPDVDALLEA